jgi:hypothetical protein
VNPARPPAPQPRGPDGTGARPAGERATDRPGRAMAGPLETSL